MQAVNSQISPFIPVSKEKVCQNRFVFPRSQQKYEMISNNNKKLTWVYCMRKMSQNKYVLNFQQTKN